MRTHLLECGCDDSSYESMGWAKLGLGDKDTTFYRIKKYGDTQQWPKERIGLSCAFGRVAEARGEQDGVGNCRKPGDAMPGMEDHNDVRAGKLEIGSRVRELSKPFRCT